MKRMMMEVRRDNEQHSKKDMMRVLGNPLERCISDVRISSIQFLRDRELGIFSKCIMKHVFIKSPFYFWSLLARQKVYMWLCNKHYKNCSFENRYKTRSLADNDYSCAFLVENRSGDQSFLLQEHVIPVGDKKIDRIIDSWWCTYIELYIARRILL